MLLYDLCFEVGQAMHSMQKSIAMLVSFDFGCKEETYLATEKRLNFPPRERQSKTGHGGNFVSPLSSRGSVNCKLVVVKSKARPSNTLSSPLSVIARNSLSALSVPRTGINCTQVTHGNWKYVKSSNLNHCHY
jgi:hypothetical protein